MSELPTLYTKFKGGWCDRCSIAARGVTRCPGCGEPMRPAEVEVTPTDRDSREEHR